MMMPEPAMEMLDRLDAVEERFERLSQVTAPPGLTGPDEPGGEQWEWGQVWAHLAEFPAYWMEQLRDVFAGPPDEVPPFGRVKSDPVRVGAIQAERHTPVDQLWSQIRGQLQDVRGMIREMTADDWDRRVRHSTLGVMDVRQVFEPFLVGHLEEHAEQLERLADRT